MLKTVALLLFSVLCIAAAEDLKFHVNKTSKACKRSVSYKAIPPKAPFRVRWDSSASCRYGGKPGSATVISSDINVAGRPDMSIAVNRANNQANYSDYTSSFSAFRVVLERVIEYAEVNGVAGYQPGDGDRPCAGGINMLAAADWSPFTITTDSDADGDAVYTLFSTSSRPASFNLSVMFSTTTLSNNKTVLDPSSFKFSFDLFNYTYNNPSCAAGLALRIFVVSRGNIRSKLANEVVDADIDFTNQDTVTVPNESGTNVGSYFAWDKFVIDSNGTMRTLYSNISNTADLTNVTGGLNVPNNWRTNTLWFSVDSPLTDFSWDPYAMATDEDIDSSSSTSGKSAAVGNTNVMVYSFTTLAIAIALLVML